MTLRSLRDRSLCLGAAHLILCTSAVFVAASAVRSQSTGDQSDVPHKTVTASGRAAQAPYNTWKKHTGTASEAVTFVHVEITDEDTGTKQVHEGGGFVARCDGFVMVPLQMLLPDRLAVSGRPRRLGRNLAITLTFASADGPLPPPLPAIQPRFFHPDVPYAMVKVNDHHFPCLPMLDPVNLREKQSVKIVYAVPKKDKPGEVEPVSVPATVGAPDGDGTSWQFADTEPPVALPGAIVVDSASGMAVGMIPGSAAPGAAPAPVSRFASFARLYDVSNEIGAAPEPTGVRIDTPDTPRETAGAAEEAGGESEMVDIPGGPIETQYGLRVEYEAAFGTTIACTPPFQIEKTAVTCGQYREFLADTGYTRLPPGWLTRDLQAPRQNGDLPVLGVSTDDASAYARWAGKRLVTPVEWATASRGAGDRWLGKYRATLAALEAAYRTRLAKTAEVEARFWGGIPYRPYIAVGAYMTGPHTISTLRGDAGIKDILMGQWLVFFDRATYETARRLINPTDLVTSSLYDQWPRMVRVTEIDSQGRMVDAWADLMIDEVHNVARQERTEPYGPSDRIRKTSDLHPPNMSLPPQDAVGRQFFIRESVQRFDTEFAHPLIVTPVGDRSFDDSVYGVRDVAANEPELLIANRARSSTELAGKFLASVFHSDLTPDWSGIFLNETVMRAARFNVRLNGGNSFNDINVQIKLYRDVHLDKTGFRRTSEVLITPDTSHLATLAGTLLAFPVPAPTPRETNPFGAGFRCAR